MLPSGDRRQPQADRQALLGVRTATFGTDKLHLTGRAESFPSGVRQYFARLLQRSLRRLQRSLDEVARRPDRGQPVKAPQLGACLGNGLGIKRSEF